MADKTAGWWWVGGVDREGTEKVGSAIWGDNACTCQEDDCGVAYDGSRYDRCPRCAASSGEDKPLSTVGAYEPLPGYSEDELKVPPRFPWRLRLSLWWNRKRQTPEQREMVDDFKRRLDHALFGTGPQPVTIGVEEAREWLGYEAPADAIAVNVYCDAGLPPQRPSDRDAVVRAVALQLFRWEDDFSMTAHQCAERCVSIVEERLS